MSSLFQGSLKSCQCQLTNYSTQKDYLRKHVKGVTYQNFFNMLLFILVSKCALFSVLAGDGHCDLLLSHLSLSALTSLRPSGALAVCGARRTAWTWRCLGSVTHGETTIASASSYRRTEHFEADLESTFNCIIFGKHFFRPPSLSRFSYLFLSADETRTSSSQQRRWVWMIYPLILGS